MSTCVTYDEQRRTQATAIEMSIVAIGTARLTTSEIAEIRRKPVFNFPANLGPQFLRHSDDQTLAALRATEDAVARMPTKVGAFTEWATISASRNLGQSAFAAVIDKYQREGPWGVSVQVIPHCTAHAVAATVSLALGTHGPCIGAGSGHNCEIEAILCAASVLSQAKWKGAWLLFSGWSPPLKIDKRGEALSDSECLAAALALSPNISVSRGQIQVDGFSSSSAEDSTSTSDDRGCRGLLRRLCENRTGRLSTSSCTGNMRVRLDLSPENSGPD